MYCKIGPVGRPITGMTANTSPGYVSFTLICSDKTPDIIFVGLLSNPKLYVISPVNSFVPKVIELGEAFSSTETKLFALLNISEINPYLPELDISLYLIERFQNRS